MKKRGSSGFTLMELIIAITIFSIVIAIGYKIISGISIYTNNQKNITLNMSSANLINQYLTKDIEQSKSIGDKETINNISYKYTIFKENTTIDYIVENHTKKNKDTYNLTRKEGSSEILIVDGQQRYDDNPFLINETKNKGVYEVIVNYKENKVNKKYSFNTSSRLTLDLDNNDNNGNIDNKVNTLDISSDINISNIKEEW